MIWFALPWRSSVLLLACLLLPVRFEAAEPIPADYFGLHISNVTNWPPFPVSSVRVANVAWGTLNPERGRLEWTALDRAVETAQKHHAGISYLFLKTPQWASQRPNEDCYAGKLGCAAPPADLADWDAFVRAVVSRYKGRITSYEIWNEPNDTKFWTGSVAELATMARRAYRIVKEIDPAAKVISPSPTYSKKGPPAEWLEGYVIAGGADSADVIGFHGYVAAKPETVRFVIKGIKDVLTRHGVAKEIWDTEAGWGRNNTIADEEERAAFVLKSYLIQWSAGVRRFYWYQYDNPEWGTLASPTAGVNKAGLALARARAWMVGATLERPCEETGGLWRCSLMRSGKQEEILWTSTATKTIPVDHVKRSAESLSGEVAAVDPAALRVSSTPILLR